MPQLYEKLLRLNEASQASLKESRDLKNVSNEILQKVVFETIDKYQQKLNVGIQDSVSDLVDAFKENLTEQILNTVSGWRVQQKDYFLFPRNCRFCFSKGLHDIVVIEQEPQIRSLLFDSKIVEQYFESNKRGQERIPISTPYNIFVLHFKSSVFVEMYFGWRTTPLKNIDDIIYFSLLPNIHNSMAVCMGRVDGDFGNNISERTDSVIDYFWNSSFNNDLSTNWWDKWKINLNLRSAKTWSERSLIDPSFILELDFRPAKRLKSIIDIITMHVNEPSVDSLSHNLSSSINLLVEGLFKKIMHYFKHTKFEKHYPKDISDVLSRFILETLNDFSALNLIIQNELEILKTKFEEEKKSPQISPKSPLWKSQAKNSS